MSKPQKKVILVVDDDQDLCEVIKFFFEMENFEVLTAHGGRVALEIIKSRHVDIVLTDVRMPDGDGIELLHETMLRNVNTPVVMLITGYMDLPVSDAYNLGACAVFSKPFDFDDLLPRIRKILEPPERRWGEPSGNSGLPLMKVSLENQSLGQAATSGSLKIGRGGMFAKTGPGEGYGVGKEIEIQIESDEKEPALAQGIVRWSRGESPRPGIGIEFTYFDPKLRNEIIELIRDRRLVAFIPKT